MVNKVITNLDSSKASGPDFIPVVVLKNCEPELSYILAKLFNKCLKESCFPDCWKVSSVVPVFKNFGERSTAKNYRPVSLLSVVSKVFEINFIKLILMIEKGIFSSTFLSTRLLDVFFTNLNSLRLGGFGLFWRRSGSILGPTLFLLPDDVICNIAIYADDTTLYSKCNQASDRELASELESDLAVDWGRKWP